MGLSPDKDHYPIPLPTATTPNQDLVTALETLIAAEILEATGDHVTAREAITIADNLYDYAAVKASAPEEKQEGAEEEGPAVP